MRVMTRLIFACLLVATRATAQGLPDKLSDAEFWKLITDVSEPTGTFPSENFVSNEVGYQWVIPDLLKDHKPGGVYIGVGPEQNFTYIAALQPKMAFIVDIRRQALLQHLIYKAVFELTDNRADFLSLLFSRPRPGGLNSGSKADVMFAAYDSVKADSLLYETNLGIIKNRLTKTHGFALSEEDLLGIEHVYSVMYRYGPHVSYNSRGGASGSPFIMSGISQGGFAPVGTTVTVLSPNRCTWVNGVLTTKDSTSQCPATLAQAGQQGQFSIMYNGYLAGAGSGVGAYRGAVDLAYLMAATDSVGEQRSFLANETNFARMRDLERRNMLVPVVGNFSGSKALRGVGQYLKDHHATVSAIYTSNVEEYLFRNPSDWQGYYTNVATLPIDSTSTFIRSIRNARPIGMASNMLSGGYITVLGSIGEHLSAFAAGRINGYSDLYSLVRH